VFITRYPIGLHEIAKEPPPGWQIANDATHAFTLSERRGIDVMPMLRILRNRNGHGFGTIIAKWCNASAGGTPLDRIPYCDFPAVPGAHDPLFVFTVAMNGCSFIVVSAVPRGVPALTPGHYRLLHDRSHNGLQRWAKAGYTVRFAAYTDVKEAGPMPAAAAAAGPNVISYNPRDYPWTSSHGGFLYARVVTNFLAWDGHTWRFGSRHYHERGDAGGRSITARDVPPDRETGSSSTQYVAL
jgi:hypothetical protein